MTEAEARELLIRFVKRYSLTRIPIITGTVSEVNENEFTCTLTVDDDEDGLKGVRLKLALDNTQNGIIMIPKDKAIAACLVLDNSENDMMLLYASEIKEYRLAADKIIYNKGQKKGLVLFDILVREINKIHTNMNILKAATTTVAGVTEGLTGLTGVFASATGSMQPAVTNDMENKNIIQ